MGQCEVAKRNENIDLVMKNQKKVFSPAKHFSSLNITIMESSLALVAAACGECGTVLGVMDLVSAGIAVNTNLLGTRFQAKQIA